MHAKISDRTVKPVVFDLWMKPQTNGFHEFVFIVLCFVVIGSFAVDGGLLQPTGCVKTTPQKTRFSQCELHKEFAYRSKLRKKVTATRIHIDDMNHSAKPNNVGSDLKHLGNT